MPKCTNCEKRFTMDEIQDIGLITGATLENDIATYECPHCEEPAIHIDLSDDKDIVMVHEDVQCQWCKDPLSKCNCK